MTYAIKSIFRTVQGEGARAGTLAVFVRFAGCNLWNGLPEGRHLGAGACARWCDTDFVDGEKLTADTIVERITAAWPGNSLMRRVVFTGGEPLLQLDDALIEKVRTAGFTTALETNGTTPISAQTQTRVDWVACAPKLGPDGQPLPLLQRWGNEMKIVLPGGPGAGWTDEMLVALQYDTAYDYYFVMPQDPIRDELLEATYLRGTRIPDAPAQYDANVQRCLRFVEAHPRWRIGAQLHKLFNVE